MGLRNGRRMTADVASALEKRAAAGAIAGANVLEDNAMGIVYGDGTTEEKLGRLVALVPMALEVVDEARATIARLREETEKLRAENEKLRAENDKLTARMESARP
jgi:PII-like signaling protein